jgi:hypothetical protein
MSPSMIRVPRWGNSEGGRLRGCCGELQRWGGVGLMGAARALGLPERPE